MISVTLHADIKGKGYVLEGKGNGPVSAVTHALQACPEVPDFTLDDFSEKSLGHTADAVAIAFVGIRLAAGTEMVYGAGEHSNIDRAAIAALFSALNRSTAL